MIDEQVTHIRQAAGARLRPELFTIRLRGPDRTRYLNGMVSNDVAKLQPGQWVRAVKATNKGKVEGVLRVRASAEVFLLDVLEVVANAVATELVKLLIMDDASLEDATEERDVITIVGPKAAEVLVAAGYDGAKDLASGAWIESDTVSVVRDDAYGLPGYELHAPAGQGQAILTKLAEAGAAEVSAEAMNVVRVEAGVPEDGPDIDANTIPLEARLDEALSFDKGCYVGQETIARAHNLGGVKHILVGLEFDGDVVPPASAELFVADVEKATGEVTSAVRSPTLGQVIALGYVRKVHEAPGTELRVVWDGGEAVARIRALPFVGS